MTVSALISLRHATVQGVTQFLKQGNNLQLAHQTVTLSVVDVVFGKRNIQNNLDLVRQCTRFGDQ